MSDRFLIVGLGNPGREYASTRHNVGFMTLDELAERHGLSFSGSRFKAKTAEGTIAGSRMTLIKPQTFMNLSGEPVQNFLNFYKLEPEQNLIVICDNLDLEEAHIRLRPNGGTAGHRGMRDIANRIGQNFARLWIGIGRPPGRMEPRDYVLRRFNEEEAALFAETAARAARAIETWIQEGIDMAMSKHNGPPPEI
jgi:PTH1 family peptidyl-tRNA hydrolase